jgi:hypothetical protein
MTLSFALTVEATPLSSLKRTMSAAGMKTLRAPVRSSQIPSDEQEAEARLRTPRSNTTIRSIQSPAADEPRNTPSTGRVSARSVGGASAGCGIQSCRALRFCHPRRMPHSARPMRSTVASTRTKRAGQFVTSACST